MYNWRRNISSVLSNPSNDCKTIVLYSIFLPMIIFLICASCASGASIIYIFEHQKQLINQHLGRTFSFFNIPLSSNISSLSLVLNEAKNLKISTMLKNASFPHHKLLFLITWLEVCDVDFFDFGLLSSYIFSTENIRARKIMKGFWQNYLRNYLC